MKKEINGQIGSFPKGQFPCWLSALINQGKAIGGFVMEKRLTQKRLKELLYYDPETGVFTWLISRCSVRAGQVAGSISKTCGYRDIGVDNKLYRASRLAWLYMEGYFPEYEMDHINRIRHDDRWCNLRHVTPQCNMRNKNIYKNNKSGITGVNWHSVQQKWQVNIPIYGKYLYLGIFCSKLKAAKARWNAEVKHGFPNCNTTSSAYQYLKKEQNQIAA